MKIGTEIPPNMIIFSSAEEENHLLHAASRLFWTEWGKRLGLKTFIPTGPPHFRRSVAQRVQGHLRSEQTHGPFHNENNSGKIPEVRRHEGNQAARISGR